MARRKPSDAERWQAVGMVRGNEEQKTQWPTEEEQTTQWPTEEEQTTQWPTEEQTTHWPNEKGQKDNDLQNINISKDRVTPTPLKPGMNPGAPER
jgi:hypothetical protein